MKSSSCSCLLLLWAFPTAIVSQSDKQQVACPEQTSFKVGGTKSMQEVARAWKDAYMDPNNRNVTSAAVCPLKDIVIGGFDWPSGAATVCNIHPIYERVEMAGMSGPFFAPQAKSDNGWSFQCLAGSDRKVILIQIAYEGIAMLMALDGAAFQCIERLGGGISVDQARWMISSLAMEDLIGKGWAKGSVPNSDDNDATHLWNELEVNCSETEILTASMESQDEALDLNVLLPKGEGIRQSEAGEQVHFTFSDVESLLQFLQENGEAIAYVPLGYLERPAVLTNAGTIGTVPVKEDGKALAYPETEGFSTKAYPLSRPMYLGVWNDPSSMLLTSPFLQFGLSDQGTKLVAEAGFWATENREKLVVRTHLQLDGGVPMEEIQKYCGPAEGQISLAGSTVMYPLEQIWSDVYNFGCPTVHIQIEQGGSVAGAERVCANQTKGLPINIGSLSSRWAAAQGQPRADHDYVYDCRTGDHLRSAIEVHVAYGGIVMIVKKGSLADECQQLIGGFTIDQLRWIYSGYDEAALLATGWDPLALKSSDNDPSTHLWSELDPRCAAKEIRIAGNPIDEGTYVSFRGMVMKDAANGEKVDVERPDGYYEAFGFSLVAYVQRHVDSIAYVGIAYYYDNQELLTAIPIRNDKGIYVYPSAETILDGSYNPLVRFLSMSLLNDRESLRSTVPLVKFGLEHPELTRATGMVPLEGGILAEMLGRLDQALAGGYYVNEASSAPFKSMSSLLYGLALAAIFFAQ